jgi:membrane-bound lytic murein transglycosylase D
LSEGPHRSVRAIALVAAVMLALALGTAGRARADAEILFPRPAAVEPNIQFWVDVFTAYSVRDFVVVDRDKIWRIYRVFHLPVDGQPTREQIDWVDAYLKIKYGDILRQLASGREPATDEERQVAALFKGESRSAYAAAADNLRVQEGMREHFHDDLLRSRYYEPSMARIFESMGLPPELVTLASIESGFQGRAKSSAGAVGIWQFTRSTGRKFMKVSRGRDDRLNPVRSTEAAAKLLRYNYEVLGDWPLAITAYNYGTAGTARAAESCGSDYCKIIQTYSGPHFGFAVKNYYAEFLAALQVHEYEDDYFPGIEAERAIPPAPIRQVASSSRHSRSRVRHTSTHHHKRTVRQAT